MLCEVCPESGAEQQTCRLQPDFKTLWQFLDDDDDELAAMGILHFLSVTPGLSGGLLCLYCDTLW